MKVAIYCRVSTDDKEQNPERQLIKCKDYCKLNNHEIICESQEYYTGDSNPFTRPAFAKLMEFKPEGIIVFSIDRLTRQHPNKTMELLSNFNNQGIKIISITEPLFNMESPFAEPLQYFITWWNNYFLKKLKADIKSGIEKARLKGTKSGKPIGRPKNTFNQFRAYELLIIQNKSLTEVSIEMKVPRVTLHRFKKVCEKNPSLFINSTEKTESSIN